MLSKNPLRLEGPDPPPKYPVEHVRLWLLATWAGDDKVDELGAKPGDVRVRRWPEIHVHDWTMKRALVVWLDAQTGRGPSFREACDQRGWNRDTAARRVEMALAMISIALSAKT